MIEKVLEIIMKLFADIVFFEVILMFGKILYDDYIKKDEIEYD